MGANPCEVGLSRAEEEKDDDDNDNGDSKSDQAAVAGRLLATVALVLAIHIMSCILYIISLNSNLKIPVK